MNHDLVSFLKHNKSNLKVYQTCRNSRRKFFILHNWTVQCLKLWWSFMDLFWSKMTKNTSLYNPSKIDFCSKRIIITIYK